MKLTDRGPREESRCAPGQHDKVLSRLRYSPRAHKQTATSHRNQLKGCVITYHVVDRKIAPHLASRTTVSGGPFREPRHPLRVRCSQFTGATIRGAPRSVKSRSTRPNLAAGMRYRGATRAASRVLRACETLSSFPERAQRSACTSRETGVRVLRPEGRGGGLVQPAAKKKTLIRYLHGASVERVRRREIRMSKDLRVLLAMVIVLHRAKNVSEVDEVILTGASRLLKRLGAQVPKRKVRKRDWHRAIDSVSQWKSGQFCNTALRHPYFLF
ncbi:hypothetical protein BJY52DRAFT_1223070 [Lactarius psammicola]|nr:hypothetical protein BJY52DRAFT_1223070 [Lactarius psammicola]